MKKSFQIILTLAFFVVLGIAVYWSGSKIAVGFTALKKEVAVSIIAVSGTVLISVLSLLISKRWEKNKDIEQQHRDKKIPIYEEFITFWFRILRSQDKTENKISEKETIEFLTKFTKQLILWGADDVLKSYSVFRKKFINIPEGQAPETVLFMFEDFLLAIRKDLGHKNKNLKRGDTLALYINDIDDYIE